MFYHPQHSRVAPNAREWVEMALLRNPDRVMMSSWYHGEENALLLLKKVASEAAINDSSLKSGAAWLCDFAAKWNSTAATLLGRGLSPMATTGGSVADALDELKKRKALAKARQKQAMERMKAQVSQIVVFVSSCWKFLFCYAAIILFSKIDRSFFVVRCFAMTVMVFVVLMHHSSSLPLILYFL